ncbi:unnamed protein product, partial [Polarella glacialis]
VRQATPPDEAEALFLYLPDLLRAAREVQDHGVLANTLEHLGSKLKDGRWRECRDQPIVLLGRWLMEVSSDGRKDWKFVLMNSSNKEHLHKRVAEIEDVAWEVDFLLGDAKPSEQHVYNNVKM